MKGEHLFYPSCLVKGASKLIFLSFKEVYFDTICLPEQHLAHQPDVISGFLSSS